MRLEITRGTCGFTLIEMVAVLAIIALMAGMGALTLATQRQQATSQNVTRQLLDYDQNSRLWAQRSGNALELALESQGMRQESIDESAGLPRAPLMLPPGFAIGDVWIAGERDAGGSARLRIGTEGRSHSYALRLVGPRQESKWILIAGPTGQSLVMNDDAVAKNILARLAQRRLDTP